MPEKQPCLHTPACNSLSSCRSKRKRERDAAELKRVVKMRRDDASRKFLSRRKTQCEGKEKEPEKAEEEKEEEQKQKEHPEEGEEDDDEEDEEDEGEEEAVNSLLKLKLKLKRLNDEKRNLKKVIKRRDQKIFELDVQLKAHQQLLGDFHVLRPLRSNWHNAFTPEVVIYVLELRSKGVGQRTAAELACQAVHQLTRGYLELHYSTIAHWDKLALPLSRLLILRKLASLGCHTSLACDTSAPSRYKCGHRVSTTVVSFPHPSAANKVLQAVIDSRYGCRGTAVAKSVQINSCRKVIVDSHVRAPVALTADHAPDMSLLAKLVSLPFFGCATHKVGRTIFLAEHVLREVMWGRQLSTSDKEQDDPLLCTLRTISVACSPERTSMTTSSGNLSRARLTYESKGRPDGWSMQRITGIKFCARSFCAANFLQNSATVERLTRLADMEIPGSDALEKVQTDTYQLDLAISSVLSHLFTCSVSLFKEGGTSNVQATHSTFPQIADMIETISAHTMSKPFPPSWCRDTAPGIKQAMKTRKSKKGFSALYKKVGRKLSEQWNHFTNDFEDHCSRLGDEQMGAVAGTTCFVEGAHGTLSYLMKCLGPDTHPASIVSLAGFAHNKQVFDYWDLASTATQEDLTQARKEADGLSYHEAYEKIYKTEKLTKLEGKAAKELKDDLLEEAVQLGIKGSPLHP